MGNWAKDLQLTALARLVSRCGGDKEGCKSRRQRRRSVIGTVRSGPCQYAPNDGRGYFRDAPLINRHYSIKSSGPLCSTVNARSTNTVAYLCRDSGLSLDRGYFGLGARIMTLLNVVFLYCNIYLLLYIIVIMFYTMGYCQR